MCVFLDVIPKGWWSLEIFASLTTFRKMPSVNHARPLEKMLLENSKLDSEMGVIFGISMS